MFSRQEASQLRKEFWTAFGTYMKPVPSVEGDKVNWLNYKTGGKDVYFRMNADNQSASVAIEITHSDTSIQELYFRQFLQVKNMLHESLGEQWTWKLHMCDENGKVVSRIYKEIQGVSVFNKAQWPVLISFFKPRIIALDLFWSSARYGFKAFK
jgi:hypothetical protein